MSAIAEIKSGFRKLSETHYLSIPSWLAVGASLQLLSLVILPTKLSALIPILYLTYCIIKVTLDSRHVTGTFKTVKQGRWTAELPEPEEDVKNDGMVIFVLGARMNHPLGPLAPGNADLAKAFGAMWEEAATNREKWGYLGNTGTLRDTTDSEGTTMIWLSYWKDLKGLQEFSTSNAHRLGQTNYAKNKYPHMGIMHETFHAPKGKWETIYINMNPWGFGKAAEGLRTLKPASSVVEYSSMFHRMRRNAAMASN